MINAATRKYAALADKNFRILCFGQVLSKFGDGAFPAALAINIFASGDIGVQQGLILGIESAAWVSGLCVGGIVADRLPRKSVMYAAEVIRIFALLGLLFSPSWAIVNVGICAVCMGLGAGLFDPAYSAMVGTMLRLENRLSGNAVLAATSSFAMTAGPALGGILTGLGGVKLAYGFDLVTFIVSLTSLVFVREPRIAREPRTARRVGIGLQWRRFESIKLVMRTNWLWLCMVQGAVILLGVRAPTKIAILADLTHREELRFYGSVLALQAAGTVVGSLAAGRGRWKRDGLSATWAQTLFAAPLLAVLAAPDWITVSVGSLVSGIGFGFFGVVWNSAIQREIPKETLGRVYAINNVATWGLDPLSLALTPVVVAFLGEKATAGLSIAILAAALVGPLCLNEFLVFSSERDFGRSGNGKK